MSPMWDPCSAHTWASPIGTYVKWVAKRSWVPCGQPMWDPQSSPHRTQLVPSSECWLGSLVILLTTTIHQWSYNIVMMNSWHQVTRKHMSLRRTALWPMLQGNIAFICLIYMQYISISVCALLLKWLSAQSAVYTRLYTQVPTDLELEITCRLVLCYDSSFNIWTALSIGNKLLLRLSWADNSKLWLVVEPDTTA